MLKKPKFKMGKKLLTLALLLIIVQKINAQENKSIKDTIKTNNEKKLSLGIDIVNRYVWRGQVSGGEYITYQPNVEYAFTKNFSLGIWATTNFNKNKFAQNGYTPKGYNEFNIYAVYSLNNYFNIELYDYYWPSFDDAVDNNYFNYSDGGVKTLDLNFVFDFSEIWLPFNTTVSTLIAGNDFKYDKIGENPKQNYTTYLELGYTLKDILKTFELKPTIGMVLNNQAEYYTYADYDKISLAKLNLEISKIFEINSNLILPMTISYIHNAATKNTDDVGCNYLVAKLSLEY